MKYLLVINTNEPETLWNALRFGATSLSRGHTVSMFLLGSAVEIEGIQNERFDVQKALLRFDELGGSALSCGTCLRSRQMEPAAVCPMSTMDELVGLTEEADRVLTFG
ncbi:MAG: DsrE family protein [Chloroflexi bacterium]|nr:DsrE family protein [Chloroflexota bacterium]